MTKKVGTKHKILLKKMSDSVGKGERLTMTDVMTKSGYSESYARSGHIKKTQTWQDLMEKYLSDDILAKKHRALLEKKETFVLSGEIIKTDQPHSDVKQAVEMGYKLRNKYGDTVVRHKFDHLSDEELEAEIARLITEAAESLI